MDIVAAVDRPQPVSDLADVALVDPTVFEVFEPEGVRFIETAGLVCPVIVLAPDEGPGTVYRQAGAAAVVSRHCQPDILVAAIRAVACEKPKPTHAEEQA